MGDSVAIEPVEVGAHKHQPEWNADRTKLYLHVPGYVDTCGIVEWSESTQQWWWWCLHSSCNESRPSEDQAHAWSDFLGHEWCSHLSALAAPGAPRSCAVASAHLVSDGS